MCKWKLLKIQVCLCFEILFFQSKPMWPIFLAFFPNRKFSWSDSKSSCAQQAVSCLLEPAGSRSRTVGNFWRIHSIAAQLTYIIYIWYIFGIYMIYIHKYIRNIFGIYLEYIWNIFEIYLKYIWNIFEIYLNGRIYLGYPYIWNIFAA